MDLVIPSGYVDFSLRSNGRLTNNNSMEFHNYSGGSTPWPKVDYGNDSRNNELHSYQMINHYDNVHNGFHNNSTSDSQYIYNMSQLDGGPPECMNVNDNVSYLNVSCESILNYSMPLYGYFTPILLLVTMTANSLIVIVLSRRNMATPTNSVLMAMALCDMFTLLFPSPGLMYMYTFQNHNKPLSPVSICYLWQAFNETLPAMFHTASIWLTLALAVQRYIYVCHAPYARTWCTMPRVRRCIIYICIAAFTHQCSRLFDKSYSLVEINWSHEIVSVCHTETASWIQESIGEDIYYTSYYLFRIIFVHLMPCVSLIVLNVLLFRAMKRAQDKREKLFRENRKKECKKLRDANCTTLMLIVVVTVFLIVEVPLAIITALHVISSLYIDFLNYHIANLFILFANFFLIVSYPINFAIYCGMSRQFRETFKEIILGYKSQTKKDCSSHYSLVNGPRTCTNETVL